MGINTGTALAIGALAGAAGGFAGYKFILDKDYDNGHPGGPKLPYLGPSIVPVLLMGHFGGANIAGSIAKLGPLDGVIAGRIVQGAGYGYAAGAALALGVSLLRETEKHQHPA